MTSFNVPIVNFESVEVTNNGDNFNLNFVFSWQADSTDTWINNSEYLQFYSTTFEVFIGGDSSKHLELKELTFNPDTTARNFSLKLGTLPTSTTFFTSDIYFSTFFLCYIPHFNF